MFDIKLIYELFNKLKSELRQEIWQSRGMNFDNTQRGLEKAKADSDYIAMMTDVELPEEDNNAQ